LLLKTFEGFVVNIFEVGPNSITLELVPKEDLLDETQASGGGGGLEGGDDLTSDAPESMVTHGR